MAIERKASGDFLGCIGGERDRFERELERLAALEYAAMVIECNFADLAREGRIHVPGKRPLHPASVIGSTAAWSVRFRLPVFLAGDWLAGRELTFRLLRHFWRYRRGEGGGS